MRYSILMMSVFGLALLASGSPASANDVEDLERKAIALKKEAAELVENGHQDEASHPDRQHLKERLQDLRAARKQAEARKASEPELNEIREQIGQMERKLAHRKGTPHLHREIPPQFQAQAEKLERAARRLQHVRVAAENLKAAEMHDMAHELMQKAEGMEHEIHAAKLELAQLMQDSAGKDQEPEGELQQLRSENEQLRREMKELREVLEQLRKDSEK